MRKEWTKETCYEAAKKCKTKSDFKNQFKAAYKLSLKNDWLKDYYWLKFSILVNIFILFADGLCITVSLFKKPYNHLRT